VALIVLDASVVIAHLDPADALHEAARAAFRQHAADDLRLPASAYAEALVDAARAGAVSETREKLASLGVEIVPVDAATAERASVLRAEHPQVRLPDALVLATGDALGAEAVLTADRRWRGFERVRVIG
jgi:predicted nucleic acid-binding protein